MTSNALHHHRAEPPRAAVRRPSQPHLRLAAPPRRRREKRLTPPQLVAGFCAGVVVGSLMATLASLPFGLGVAATSLQIALVALGVGGLALLRAREEARRAQRRRHAKVTSPTRVASTSARRNTAAGPLRLAA